MRSDRLVLLLSLALLPMGSLQAQGLGGLLGKKEVAAPTVNADALQAEARDYMKQFLKGTDLQASAGNDLAKGLGPKGAALQAALDRYHQLRKGGKESRLEEPLAGAIGAVSQEMEKVAADPAAMEGKGASFVMANLRMAAMLYVQNKASKKAPDLLKRIQDAAKSLASNPLQAGKAKNLLDAAGDLGRSTSTLTSQLSVAKKVYDATSGILKKENIAPKPLPTDLDSEAGLDALLR